LDKLADRDKQMEELKVKLEELSVQLVEKENWLTTEKEIIIGLETALEEQKPIHELLDQNGIDYEQLSAIIKSENNSKVLEIKEMETTQAEEESIRADETTQAEIDETTEAEETSEQESTKEKTTTETETFEEETKEGETKGEERQEKTAFKGLIFIILIVLLLLAGGSILFLGRKENTRD